MIIENIEQLNSVEDGSKVMITPNVDNPIHKQPVEATFSGGYFMCEGSDPMDGPDYYFRDVFQFNSKIEVIQ